MKILICGGAGFVGSHLVHMAVARGHEVIVVDKLTYAGRLDNLYGADCPVIESDICDRTLVAKLLDEHQPDVIANFAAETHVDRSIDGPGAFVQTNIVGTYELLEAARAYGKAIYLNVSTDEVFGDVDENDENSSHHYGAVNEDSPFAPSSPYAASKAAADCLARAYKTTYDMSVVTTWCSNNFGPRQFPEKFIPTAIRAAMKGEPIPLYGDGKQIRDWIYVEDHCDALFIILDAALADVLAGHQPSDFVIGAREPHVNAAVAAAIAIQLGSTASVTFVEDRPGHDRRYAVDPYALERLGWRPKHDFAEALRRTIAWYVEHRDWWESYDGKRLGVLT